jgi:hypothetical protein
MDTVEAITAEPKARAGPARAGAHPAATNTAQAGGGAPYGGGGGAP